MYPASQCRYTFQFFQDVVSGIAVRLYGSLKILEELQDYPGSPGTFIIGEEHQAVDHAPYQPQVTFYRPVLLVVDDGNRRFIGLDVIGGQDEFPQSVVGWPHQVGYIVEPNFDCGRGYADSQPFEHLYLAVERKMVHILPDHQVRQQRCAGIALGNGFILYRRCNDFLRLLAHSFMPYGHPDVQFGRLEFQVFGRFGILEQDPFVFMTRITVRIDIFFHAAEVVRKFLTDRNPFFMFLDRHLSAFGNLLDSLADRLFLFRSHFRQVKVQLELVGVIRNTPLLGHGTPHLALQIKKFLFKLGNLVFLGPQSPVALLDGLVFFSRSGFVVGLHPTVPSAAVPLSPPAGTRRHGR